MPPEPDTGLRVLVVEDQFLIAMDTEQVLVGLGCKVIGPVPTVARALALVEGESIDFAILDVNLGRERSTPVAEALRARGVPFALASGYDGTQLAEEVLRRAPHLGKPLERRLLMNVLAGLRDKPETS